MAAAHGVVFVTPEYNRSVPGGLKECHRPRVAPVRESAWKGKRVGVLGVSVGAPGTSMAQQHLRNILAYLDMLTRGQPEVFIQLKEGMFAENGIANVDTRAFLQPMGGCLFRLGEEIRRRRCRRVPLTRETAVTPGHRGRRYSGMRSRTAPRCGAGSRSRHEHEETLILWYSGRDNPCA